MYLVVLLLREHYNSDGNPAFAWASLISAWPGSNEAKLATVTFDIAEGATGTTVLDIVRVSNTVGYAFDGQSHDVVITAEAGDPNL